MADLFEGNNIFLLFSYIAGAVILVGMTVASWRAKKKDEADLRKLEQHIVEQGMRE